MTGGKGLGRAGSLEHSALHLDFDSNYLLVCGSASGSCLAQGFRKPLKQSELHLRSLCAVLIPF